MPKILDIYLRKEQTVLTVNHYRVTMNSKKSVCKKKLINK